MPKHSQGFPVSLRMVCVSILHSNGQLLCGYGYYNSVLDAAPNSYAAEEIRDLTREVLDLLH